MKNVRKILALLLAIVLVTALLAGCGAASTGNGAQATASAASAASASSASSGTAAPAASDTLAKHESISVAMWDIGKAFPDGGGADPVRDYIYKKLNIDIVPMNTTWDDYVQKIQVWSASKQLPDLFAIDAVTRPMFSQWIDQGVVKALPSDLSAYPNLKQVVDSTKEMITYPMGDPNGKIYCIPRGSFKDTANNAVVQGLFIRKDWMEAAGITKKPDNLDEFKALLQAYVKQGKIGLTVYNASWLTALINPYEPGVVQNVYRWIRVDGKWEPAFMSKNLLNGLKYVQSLLKEGLLDKDFALFKADEGENKFAAGKAGAIAGSTDMAGASNLFSAKYDALNPNSDWSKTFDWVGEFPSVTDGKRYADTGPGFWSESYINSNVDDTKLDRILRLFEFYLSDEGVRLVKDGIEGVDYTKNSDGTIALIPTKDAQGNEYTVMSQKYPSANMDYFSQWAGDSYMSDPRQTKVVNFMKPYMDWAAQNTSSSFTDYRLDMLQYPSKAKLTADFQVDMTQALLSSNIDAEWAKIVQNHLNNGYNDIIKEVNDLAAKDGIK